MTEESQPSIDEASLMMAMRSKRFFSLARAVTISGPFAQGGERDRFDLLNQLLA
jgi:hypothetical protein